MADGSFKEYSYPKKPSRKVALKPIGALSAIFNLYTETPAFKRELMPVWQRRKEGLLREIAAAFPTMTADELEDKSTRGRFYEFRDRYAEQPFKADALMSALNTALEWAYDRGMIGVNHAARMKPLTNPKHSRHRDKQYSADQEEAILARLPEDLKNAYLFALYTGFRRGDVVSITWAAIDKNGWLEWKPEKTRRTTNVAVHIPTFALPPLAALLERLPRHGDRVIMAGRNVAFGQTNLSHRWGKWMAALNMEGMRFQDIRHTTSSRLIFAGCTEAERAMILGHATAQGTGQIYIARMKELALFAYQKWWAQMNGEARVIKLENFSNSRAP